MEAAQSTEKDPLLLRLAGRLLSVAIVAGAIVAGLYVGLLYYVYPRTDDAYVRANSVGIAPHVSGPIVSLPVVDNQHVKEGELLFVVDPRPYKSALDAAEARLDLTNLEIKAYADAISSAQAEQKRRAADAAYARQYLDRIEPLLKRHFVTANDVFDARSKARAAEAEVDNVGPSGAPGAKSARPIGRYQRPAQSRRGCRLRRKTERELLLRAGAV